MCTRCGGPLASGRDAWLSWELARQRARLARWAEEGAIDAATRRALDERLATPDEAGGRGAAGEGANATTAAERGATRLVSGTAAFAREVSERWSRLSRAVEREGSPPPSGRDDEAGEGRASVEAGRAIFARGAQGAVVGPGVEALASLDDDRDAAAGPGRPLGALQIFWFIGTLLVLAGSVMGVREAWRSLEGVWRPVAIAGAFFLYHVLFVGLARTLARRSALTGVVLTTIAAGLLPVTFAAAAVAIGQRPALGVPFSGALLVASALTLAFAGRTAGGPGAGLALALGLCPALALELLVGTGDATILRRVAGALGALGPVVLAAARVRRSLDRPATLTLAAAGYGALATGVLGLYGGPGAPALDLDDDPLATSALVSWLAVASTAAWWASAGPSFAARAPKVGAVPSIVALATLLGAACAAFFAGFDGVDTPGALAYAPLAVLALAAAVLSLEQRARRGALHLAAPVAIAATLLAGRLLAPTRPPLWPASCALVPAALLTLAGFTADRPRRLARAAWGIVAGTLALGATLVIEAAAPNAATTLAGASLRPPLAVSALTGALLALTAHAGGRTPRPWLHYPAALFSLAAALAFFAPPRPEPWAYGLLLVCAGLAFAYGLAAFAYAAFAPADDDRRPLDDASLLLAVGGVWLGVLVPPFPLAAANAAPTLLVPGATPGLPPLSFLPGAAALAGPALALAAVLLVRAARDRSGLVVFHGALALALAARLATSARGAAGEALVDGAAALAFATVAALRAPPGEAEPRFGRAVFGLFPLPLGGRGRTLLDGFAVGAFLLAAIACKRAFSWMANAPLSEAERPFLVLGLACVIAAALVSFAARSFEIVLARGSVFTLSLGGVVIALAGVANRIGRPLAPAVVGLRLSIVVVLVWLVARAFVAAGPRVAGALGRSEQGSRYHFVPHAGVAALALLLLVDAWLVGAPTATRALAVVPPLMLVGGGLGALLLYRSFGYEPLAHVGLLSLLGASTLAAAQRALVGPELVPLDSPGGRWVPVQTADAAAFDWLDPTRFLLEGDDGRLLWGRGWLGLAGAALFFAAALAAMTRAPAFARALRGALARPEPDEPAIKRALAATGLVAALLLAPGLATLPTLPPAALFFAAAALSALATSPSFRAIPLVLAAPTLAHALAQSGDVVPAWAGPLIAVLALAAVVIGRSLSAHRGRDPALLLKTQLAAAAYAPLALLYASAAGGAASHDAGIVVAASAPLRASFASPLTLALLALAGGVAALGWRGGLATILAALPPLALAFAGASLAAVFAPPGGISAVFAREGALLAAGLALAAAASHAAAFAAARAERHDASVGFAAGRDVTLVASVLAMAALGTRAGAGGPLAGLAGFGALGLALLVALHAAAWKSSARHVALVEALLVAMYAFATREFQLRPEVHATAGLFYGFSLVGVLVVARRLKIEPVAGATRWFIAALPALLAWLTADGNVSNADASFALGSSALYGATAWAERSRIFGSLASIAANLGLVAFALAQGLDGVETYLGPLGILVTALAQIFAPTLDRQARGALRVLGGALLYLPAGIKLTARLGESTDGAYSVAFGAVCLLGVLVGIVLRVRAYLALGTLFLTLDVVANLANAGLRDHRIGFVLLSASGLAILGAMIAVTLRREQALAFARRVRSRLRGWD